MEIILELNIKLVTKQAIYYSKILSGHGLTTEDLIQEGCLGLMKAVDKFDVEKGLGFSTYALHWINHAITRAICNKDMIVRFPVYLTEQVSKVIRYESKLLLQNGKIDESELCLDLGITSEKYIELKKYYHQFGSLASLDKTLREERDTEPLEFKGGKNIELIVWSNKDSEDPSVIYEETELHEEILYIMNSLKERERKVIEYRFGLIDGRARTLKEIGRICNVTGTTVSKIEFKAFKKLRHRSRSMRLKVFTGADIESTVKRKVPKKTISKGEFLIAKGKRNSAAELSNSRKIRSSSEHRIDINTEQGSFISNLSESYSEKHRSNSIMLEERNKRSLEKNNIPRNKIHEKYLKEIEEMRQFEKEVNNIGEMEAEMKQ